MEFGWLLDGCWAELMFDGCWMEFGWVLGGVGWMGVGWSLGGCWMEVG